MQVHVHMCADDLSCHSSDVIFWKTGSLAGVELVKCESKGSARLCPHSSGLTTIVLGCPPTPRGFLDSNSDPRPCKASSLPPELPS